MTEAFSLGNNRRAGDGALAAAWRPSADGGIAATAAMPHMETNENEIARKVGGDGVGWWGWVKGGGGEGNAFCPNVALQPVNSLSHGVYQTVCAC